MDTRERINHLKLDGWKPDQIELLKTIASMSYKDGFNDGSEEWKSKLDNALQAFTKVYNARAIFTAEHYEYDPEAVMRVTEDSPIFTGERVKSQGVLAVNNFDYNYTAPSTEEPYDPNA